MEKRIELDGKTQGYDHASVKHGMMLAAEIASAEMIGTNRDDDAVDRAYDRACKNIIDSIKAKAKEIKI